LTSADVVSLLKPAPALSGAFVRGETAMIVYSMVKECEGCGHATGGLVEGATCAIYMRPFAKWNKLGGCEGATHVARKTVEAVKVRVGQQKQKKGDK